MSKNQKNRIQFCTEVSLDTWKSTSALNMINKTTTWKKSFVQ